MSGRCAGCGEPCRACLLIEENAAGILDAGDLMLTGVTIAIAEIVAGSAPLAGMHLCPAHHHFATHSLREALRVRAGVEMHGGLAKTITH